MNDKKELHAIIELAAKLETDFNTINKKVKKYNFKADKKMINGRFVKAVYLSQQEFEVIQHDLEYNKKKYSTKNVVNDYSFSNKTQQEKPEVIDISVQNEQSKNQVQIIEEITAGYKIAIQEKDNTINVLKQAAEEKQQTINHLISNNELLNKHLLNSTQQVEKLLNEINELRKQPEEKQPEKKQKSFFGIKF